MADEVTYLEQPGAIVTSARIELGGQTFAVRNVGSVKVAVTPRTWLAGVLLLVAALPLGLNAWPLGLMAAATGAYMLWRGGPTYNLVMVSGGGETMAVSSRNAEEVEKLRAAVARAISAR